jgi:hypothetical protein
LPCSNCNFALEIDFDVDLFKDIPKPKNILKKDQVMQMLWLPVRDGSGIIIGLS